MNVPSFPAAQLLVFWGGVQAGFNGFSHRPAEYAKSVSCPVLFLHGEDDTSAPLSRRSSRIRSRLGCKEDLRVLSPCRPRVDRKEETRGMGACRRRSFEPRGEEYLIRIRGKLFYCEVNKRKRREFSRMARPTHGCRGSVRVPRNHLNRCRRQDKDGSSKL
jgi:hypothetical protein